MPTEPDKFDLFDLLPLVSRTIRHRLDVLAEIQKVEAQTKQINRPAAWERLQWMAFIWKMFRDIYSGVQGSSAAKGAGRAGKDVIDKIFEKDLEAMLRNK